MSYYEGLGQSESEVGLTINQSEGDNVVRRRQPSNGYNGFRRVILQRNSHSTNEAGRILKLCLERHFEPKSQTGDESDSSDYDSTILDSYIEEVFNQLDYHK